MLCDPNDPVYCNGLTDCVANQGNKFLFEELMNMITTMIQENTFIMVLLKSLSDSYIINGNGSTRTAAQISAPSNDFADRAQSAVVADKLYLFGGSNDFRKVSIFLFFFKI